MRKLKVYGLPEKIKLQKTNNFKSFILIALIGTCISNTTLNTYQEIEKNAELTFLKKNSNLIKEEINLTVSTNNIQNKYYNDNRKTNNTVNYKLIEDGTNIIGTQETTKKAIDDLRPITEKHNYKITGSYRWGDNFLGQLLTISNEANSIIAKENIYMSETINLPWLPSTSEELKQVLEKKSFTPRIATHCVAKIENSYIHIFNTHLDYAVSSIQKRQMDKILNEIDKNIALIDLPIIIMGDFNTTKNSHNMRYFNNELAKRNIKMIENDNPTFRNNIIDYIFVSNDFVVNYCEVIKNNESDHDAIQATLKLNSRK